MKIPNSMIKNGKDKRDKERKEAVGSILWSITNGANV